MDSSRQKAASFQPFLFLFLHLVYVSQALSLSEDQTTLHDLRKSFWSVWNTSEQNPCWWPGVSCDGSDRVINIILSSVNLSGKIPSAIGNLQSLSRLDLSRNAFIGSIPYQLGNCTSLLSLNFSRNYLTGSIPTEFHQLRRLQRLDLSYNQLNDSIPQGLGDLENLLQLDLSSNSLSGSIPETFSKLESITVLSLSQNKLSGPIPDALGKLSNLTSLSAYENLLQGQIPFGASSSRLTTLNLASNKLSGSIPNEICASSQLEVLILSSNNLSGILPLKLGLCSSLSNLRVGSNSLYGEIPSGYGQFKKLTYFEADGNNLSGVIPSTISGWSNLALLNLAKNRLVGRIPMELTQLSTLQELHLYGNQLTGEIPKGFSNLRSLSRLDLSSNLLNGSIPLELCEVSKLEYLLLQNNLISGHIPEAIGGCTQLLQLQLGHNLLNGRIPKEIGSLTNLQIALNLSWNKLGGSIPDALGFLTKLVSLDLSHNQLSGVIPPALRNMASLLDIDFSSNNLTGQVLHSPIFSKSPKTSFANNSGLCGPPLVACGNEYAADANMPRSKRKTAVFWEALGTSVFCILLGIGFAAIVTYWVMLKHRRTSAIDPRQSLLVNRIFVEKYEQAMNFERIKEATQSTANIISSNHFSTMYEVILPSGFVLAAKRLHSAEKGVAIHQRKMMQELERLSKLSHENVMRPIGYLLQNELTILLYDYVPICSLAQQLHKNADTLLDWPSRYKIALEAARGLSFLHLSCYPPMIHMDITSNNIYLGSNFDVRIGDVEIAKLVDPTKNTGSITAVAGSFGYIAPEYAFTMQVSMATNVYSFGVVLLELVTGRLPVDESFGEGKDLVKWVHEASLRGETPEQILDERISTSSFAFRQEMLAVLKVALSCTHVSPSRRPRMKKVVEMILDANQLAEVILASEE